MKRKFISTFCYAALIALSLWLVPALPAAEERPLAGSTDRHHRRLDHRAEALLEVHRGLPAGLRGPAGHQVLPVRLGRRDGRRLPTRVGQRPRCLQADRGHHLLRHERRPLRPSPKTIGNDYEGEHARGARETAGRRREKIVVGSPGAVDTRYFAQATGAALGAEVQRRAWQACATSTTMLAEHGRSSPTCIRR